MLNHLLVTAIFSYVHLIKPTVTKVEEMVWAYETQMLHFFLNYSFFKKRKKENEDNSSASDTGCFYWCSQRLKLLKQSLGITPPQAKGACFGRCC